MKTTDFINKYTEDAEYNDEAGLTKNSLHTIIRVATHLERELADDENLPEWVQEKIGDIKGAMVSVMDYMISQHEMGKQQHMPGFNADAVAESFEYKINESAIKPDQLAQLSQLKRSMQQQPMQPKSIDPKTQAEIDAWERDFAASHGTRTFAQDNPVTAEPEAKPDWRTLPRRTMKKNREELAKVNQAIKLGEKMLALIDRAEKFPGGLPPGLRSDIEDLESGFNPENTDYDTLIHLYTKRLGQLEDFINMKRAVYRKPKTPRYNEGVDEGMVGRAIAKGKDWLERVDGNPNPSNLINQQRKEKQDQRKKQDQSQRQQHVAEDWQKTNKQDKTDGMSTKAVKAYRRENPGSKLQTAVTKKPSELKAGSKDAKRRKSFCARMSGNKGPMKDEKGRPTPKAKALARWNCESVEQVDQQIEAAQISEIKQRLDPHCWHDKHKEGTKIKGGVRVNNCVPNESMEEGIGNNPVTNAITRRIMSQRVDLLAKYGPDNVGNAIDEVADFVGDVEEIGSSDVSAWVSHVEQILRDTGELRESRQSQKTGFSKWAQNFEEDIHEIHKSLSEDATGGASCSGNMAVVVNELGQDGMSKKQLNKKLGGYTNVQTKGGKIKVKGSY